MVALDLVERPAERALPRRIHDHDAPARVGEGHHDGDMVEDLLQDLGLLDHVVITRRRHAASIAP